MKDKLDSMTQSEWRASTTFFDHIHIGDMAFCDKLRYDELPFHSAFIACLFKGTATEAQSFVDNANTFSKIGDEDNQCKSGSPCSLTGFHMCGGHEEWSRHVVLVEFDFKGIPRAVIVPSWHTELHSEWMQMLENSKKTKYGDYFCYPFPISSFDVSHIEQIAKHIPHRFAKLTKNEKMYLVCNLAGGDTREKFYRFNGMRRKDRYEGPSIKMMGGKVEEADYPRGSDGKRQHLQASINAAEREFDEESHGVFRKLNTRNSFPFFTTQVSPKRNNVNCRNKNRHMCLESSMCFMPYCGCMTARVATYVLHDYLTVEDLNPKRVIH